MATIDVMMLCEWPTLNGGEHSMLSVLELLSAAGVRFVVAAPPAGPLAEALHRLHISVLPFVWRDPAGNRRPKECLREQLHQLLRAYRPRLLHANSLSAAIVAGPTAAALRVPAIGHLRDIIRLNCRAVAELNAMDRLIAVSEATRTFHAAQGVSAEKIVVIYNGVDLDRFRPRPPKGRLHAALGLPPNKPLFGAIGQLGVRKGWDLILEAMTLLEAEAACAHLAVVGEHHSHKREADEYAAGLYRFAAERLPGRVHFLGRCDNVPELLAELTILVHAARQEPLGRVLLEAAATGCTIAATDVGGTREIFPPDSHSAVLVPPENPSALAQALTELLGRPELRCALARAARKRAEEQFDRRTTASRLLDEYRCWLG